MASVVDTTVKFYRDDFPGMPQINAAIGTGIALFDYVLVDGGTPRTLTALDVVGGVATATLASDPLNVNLVGSVQTFEGCTSTALNGEQRITEATSTTLKFDTAAANSSQTTGATVKTSPAGYEKLFSGTNLAAYRSLSGTTNGCAIRMADAAGLIYVRGYMSMSSINDGTTPFPTTGQEAGSGAKWPKTYNPALNTPNIKFDVFSDGRAIFWSPMAGYSSNTTWTGTKLFGFFEYGKYIATDGFNSVLTGGRNTDDIHNGGDFGTVGVDQSYPDRYWAPKSYTGVGSAVNLFMATITRSTLKSGLDTNYGSWPPLDGRLRTGSLEAVEAAFNGTSSVPRGEIPGYVHLHASIPLNAFSRGDIIQVNGRNHYVLKPTVNFSQTGAQFNRTDAIDITGPWTH